MWLFLDALTAVPDHLGWRNELGELCSRSRPALLGDSRDSGQNLARLGTWVSRHSAEGAPWFASPAWARPTLVA
jgi:hypothetical protein